MWPQNRGYVIYTTNGTLNINNNNNSNNNNCSFHLGTDEGVISVKTYKKIVDNKATKWEAMELWCR